jgi:hypothetical protein
MGALSRHLEDSLRVRIQKTDGTEGRRQKDSGR